MALKNATQTEYSDLGIDVSDIDFAEELPNPDEVLEAGNEGVVKRAEWEAFDFRVLESGNVEVVNNSHGEENAEDHTYHVQLDDDAIPYWCVRRLPDDEDDDWEDCPAMKWHDGDCKHCHGVARNDVIIAVVRAVKQHLAGEEN